MVSKKDDVRGKTEVLSGHKPSERFTRKPVHARSKASRSERVRVADLVSKLVDKPASENEQTKFNGYKPGPELEAPPG
jgi:hypothetical protein